MALTKSDLHNLKKIISEEVKDALHNNNLHLFEYMDRKFITKDDLRVIEEKISRLPAKDEFYKKMDKWMKATTTKDIEKSAHKLSHNRTNNRLDKIESHLGISSAY